MIGDADNTLGTDGDAPASDVVPEALDATGQEPRVSRPFSSWAAANEKPSAAARLGSWVGGLFRRKPKVDDDDVDAELAEDEDAQVDESPAEHVDDHESDELSRRYSGRDGEPVFHADRIAPVSRREPPAAEAEPVVEERGIAPEPVAPPDDFRFPWTRKDAAAAEPEVEPVAAMPDAPADDTVDGHADSFDTTGEIDAEPTPEPRRPGFFARLFGKKTIPEIPESFEATVEDHEVEVHEAEVQGVPDAPFTSVDEALPVDDLATSDHDQLDHDETLEPVAEKKPGFFARLFRGKPKVVALEDELSAGEQMDTAADALSAIGDEVMPGAVDAATAPTGSFDSIDSALPMTQDVPVEYMKFAPPAAPSMPAVTQDAPSFGADFFAEVNLDGPASPQMGERTTGEMDAVADDASDEMRSSGERTTDEMTPVSDEMLVSGERKTDEVSVVEDDGRPTDELELVEDDRDTDELVEVGEEDTEPVAVDTRGFFAKLFGKKAVITGEQAPPGAPEASTFLVSKFRDFYNEIIRFKNQKSEFTAGFATAIVTDYTADISPQHAAQELSKSLQQILELQAAQATWMKGEVAERYPDAQYAMVCLADEMFTTMDWEGQSAWQQYRLEHRLYQMNAADVEFYRRVDKLLREEDPSPVARDLARLYMLVLAAGFRGKYRPFGLTRPMAEYRRRLYEYINAGGDPLMLYADDRRILPEAASRTLASQAVSRFSAMQRWAAIVMILVLGYTFIAHMAWNRVSADLKDVTARIKSTNGSAGAQ